jgi:hypothetical protein
MLLKVKQRILIVLFVSLERVYTTLRFIQVTHILIHTYNIILLCISRNTLQLILEIILLGSLHHGLYPGTLEAEGCNYCSRMRCHTKLLRDQTTPY